MSDKGKIFGGGIGWFFGGPIGGLLGMIFGEFADEREERQLEEKDPYYELLRIPPSASNSEVKQAYRKLALKYHPDKVLHRSEDDRKWAEEYFKRITEAYERIKKQRNIA
jgi:preprotein translocase subunit Sec63